MSYVIDPAFVYLETFRHFARQHAKSPASCSMARGISPPPLKRVKLSTPSFASLPPSSPPSPPASDTLRIFSWNINGIKPFLQKPITDYFQKPATNNVEGFIPPASLRDFLCRHHWPAVLFLQEVKIAIADINTQEAVKKAVNARSVSESSARGPAYDVYFTLPSDRNNARGLGGSGKVYGVCSIIRADLPVAFKTTKEVRTVVWDKEGRVSIVQLSSSESQFKLAILNIYAVNGTDSPYRDPRTGAAMGTRHDRKLEFHKLLMKECISMEKQGWDIVVGGDFNVAPARIDGHPNLRTFPTQHVINRADFLTKFLGQEKQGTRNKSEEETKSWEGVDVWRTMNPDSRRFTWFTRTREWGTCCDRVDYFIAGKRLWNTGRVFGAGILDSEAERGPSDHVPLWIDISLEPTSQNPESME